VVVSSPADFQNISQILKQLDRQKKQVYVEAMIIEATIDKVLEVGTKWRATAQRNGDPVVIEGWDR